MPATFPWIKHGHSILFIIQECNEGVDLCIHIILCAQHAHTLYMIVHVYVCPYVHVCVIEYVCDMYVVCMLGGDVLCVCARACVFLYSVPMSVSVVEKEVVGLLNRGLSVLS